MIERVCQQCGKHFFVSPNKCSGQNGHKAIFCSHECHAKTRIIQRTERVCETCGNHFFVKPYQVKHGGGRFCSLKCYGASLGHISHSPLCGKYERSEAQKQMLTKQCSLRFKGKRCKPRSEGHKRRISEAKKGKPVLKRRERRVERECLICGTTFTTHISRVKHGYGKFCSRKCFGTALAEKWRSPEYVAMMMKGMAVKPTKPEKKLQKILDRFFVGQYKYTGDGKLIINGRRPDFANCNGKKDLLEVFGDYWHSPQVTKERWERTELGTMMDYNSLGYRCLIIWERELNNLPEEEIVDKIKLFARGKK